MTLNVFVRESVCVPCGYWSAVGAPKVMVYHRRKEFPFPSSWEGDDDMRDFICTCTCWKGDLKVVKW